MENKICFKEEWLQGSQFCVHFYLFCTFVDNRTCETEESIPLVFLILFFSFVPSCCFSISLFLGLFSK